MFDQNPTYHFESDIDTQDHVLLETRLVDLSTVTISQDEAGLLVVTRNMEAEKLPAPTPADDDDELLNDGVGPKYRLEPEGDMFRIVAIRDIYSFCIDAGDKGGLVSSSDCLSQLGDSWIGVNAKVTHGCHVGGDAHVHGESILTGHVQVGDQARVYDSALTGYMGVAGSASVASCTFTSQQGFFLSVQGVASLASSRVDVTDHQALHIVGGCVREAHIRNRFELVSFYTGQRFGWLDVFRGIDGDQRFSIGCQNHGSAEEIRRLGRDYEISDAETLMLESFIQLAAAARQEWQLDEVATKSGMGEEASVATPIQVGAPVLSQYGEDLSRNTTF